MRYSSAKKCRAPSVRQNLERHLCSSPNQVLTHAARAAASQLDKVPFQAPPVAARGAREGLWSEQHLWYWARAARTIGSGQSQTVLVRTFTDY